MNCEHNTSNRQTDRHTDRQTDRHRETDTQTHRQTDSERQTSVIISLARSRAKSGDTKHASPLSATPASYMFWLLKSCTQPTSSSSSSTNFIAMQVLQKLQGHRHTLASHTDALIINNSYRINTTKTGEGTRVNNNQKKTNKNTNNN